jgi:hypothetical protein
MKWWHPFAFCVSLLAACSSEEAPLDAGVGADASFDVAIVATDASSDATSDAGTCDDCGSPRFTAECVNQENACLNDAGCSAIRSCVFSGADASAPCALDETGAACVDGCIARACTDANSVALYRALDQCAYCTACTVACTAYCSGFSDAGTTCPAH